MPRPAIPRPPSSPPSAVGQAAATAGDGRAREVVPPPGESTSPREPSTRLRVFVADDHPLVLRALREVIGDQPDLTLVGEAGTERALLASAALAQSDVLVVDISLGRELIERARAAAPRLAVVAHSILPRDPFEGVALKAGAAAFVAKGDHPAALLDAIRRLRRP